MNSFVNIRVRRETYNAYKYVCEKYRGKQPVTYVIRTVLEEYLKEHYPDALRIEEAIVEELANKLQEKVTLRYNKPGCAPFRALGFQYGEPIRMAKDKDLEVHLDAANFTEAGKHEAMYAYYHPEVIKHKELWDTIYYTVFPEDIHERDTPAYIQMGSADLPPPPPITQTSTFDNAGEEGEF